MGAIITFLVIISLSLLITRIATTAFSLTGLSREAAKFQSRSAFTGVGYTTNESESITGHPVRRRIALILMLLGNAGLISAISSLVITFTGAKNGKLNDLTSLSIILGAILLLWIISTSKYLDKALERLINWALNKYTDLNIVDYPSFLNLTSNYEVSEMNVEEDDWLTDKKLSEAELRREGIFVLGIQREDGNYLGVPKGDVKIENGDLLKLYGRKDAIKKLKDRKKDSEGDEDHEEASNEQERVRASEKAGDHD